MGSTFFTGSIFYLTPAIHRVVPLFDSSCTWSVRRKLEETFKAMGLFYLMCMPWKVKDLRLPYYKYGAKILYIDIHLIGTSKAYFLS